MSEQEALNFKYLPVSELSEGQDFSQLHSRACVVTVCLLLILQAGVSPSTLHVHGISVPHAGLWAFSPPAFS